MTDAAILKDASPEQLDSFVQLVALVANADGQISSVEESVLVQRLLELSHGRMKEEHLRSVLAELPAPSHSGNNWRAECINMYKGAIADPEMRAELFRLAVEVAEAENGIGLREGRMLVNLISELEIEPERAKEILKQKGS